MADRGFDACEYIWSNDFAMQQLLFILRRTQSYCTDTECFSLSRLPGPRDVPAASDFFITWLVLGFLVLMYAFRPNSLRRSRNEHTKDRDDQPGSSGGPPAPPPATN